MFERYLQGIDCPIGKQELLRTLEENSAPGAVVDQASNGLPKYSIEVPRISYSA